MDPYIMIWGIPPTSGFYLRVTGGKAFSGQDLHPPVGVYITPGWPYKYVLFDTLNIDIYGDSNPPAGEKLESTTITMIRKDQLTYPLDVNNILKMTYVPSLSEYPPDDPYHWKSRNYFEVTAPGLRLRPPTITNDGWSSGQGNTHSEPIVGESF